MSSWIVEVDHDPETGELILPLTDEILEETGWKFNDVLEWVDQKDGTWLLRKKDERETDSTKTQKVG